MMRWQGLVLLIYTTPMLSLTACLLLGNCVIMAYVVTAYIVMTYDLHSYDLHSYGLHGDGLDWIRSARYRVLVTVASGR